MLIRTNLNDGALKFLNQEVITSLNEFIVFLNKIRVLRLECKVLGALKPLIPDHMIREENYFIQKLNSYEKRCIYLRFDPSS